MPPAYTQAMVNASLKANPNASKGGYEGSVPMPNPLAAPGAGDNPATPVVENSPIPGVDPFKIAQANDAYTRAVNSINTRRNSTLAGYGFKATGFDDSGAAQGLEVDPTSTYGQYQRLLDQEAQDSQAAEDSSAGRGFSGGVANQAASRLRYQQGADQLNLTGNLLGSLGSLASESDTARGTWGSDLLNARLDPTRSAIDQGNFTPADSVNPADELGPAIDRPTPGSPSVAAKLAKKITAKQAVTKSLRPQTKTPMPTAPVRPNAYITNRNKRG